ncbi:UNVERIFIED_CONTAM: hypothetical protein K2H54_042336 [Gekko kuhli]
MLQNVSSGSQLLTIDMKLSENLLDRRKVDIGFAAKKLLKETKLSEHQVAEFCLECRNMNFHEERCVKKYQVYDAVLNCGGLESVVIDRNLLQSIRHAHACYTEHLEAKHHKQQEEIQKKEEKKKLEGQIKHLESAKKRLREEAKMEEETIDEKMRLYWILPALLVGL